MLRNNGNVKTSSCVNAFERLRWAMRQCCGPWQPKVPTQLLSMRLQAPLQSSHPLVHHHLHQQNLLQQQNPHLRLPHHLNRLPLQPFLTHFLLHQHILRSRTAPYCFWVTLSTSHSVPHFLSQISRLPTHQHLLTHHKKLSTSPRLDMLPLAT